MAVVAPEQPARRQQDALVTREGVDEGVGVDTVGEPREADRTGPRADPRDLGPPREEGVEEREVPADDPSDRSSTRSRARRRDQRQQLGRRPAEQIVV